MPVVVPCVSIKALLFELDNAKVTPLHLMLDTGRPGIPRRDVDRGQEDGRAMLVG